MIWKYENNLKPDQAKLIELIREHQQIKKGFEIQDAYKLIFQSVYGIEHILGNADTARKYLVQEFESIDATDDEQLIENISLSEKMARVNLRPYKYRDGNIDLLFQAMLQSAAASSVSREILLAWWDQFKYAVFEGKLNFNKKELKIFDHKLRLNNYPAMHHSPAYRESNHPAYRVLIGYLAAQLFS